MKKVSSIALAATLVVGLGGVSLAVPAVAKKEEAPKGPVLSEKFRTPAAAAQKALQANDLVTAETNLALAEAAASNDDEKAVASSLRVPLESKKAQGSPGGSSPALVTALDTAIANPKLSPELLKSYSTARGQIAYNARQYSVALPLLERARAGGSTDTNLILQIAQAKAETGNIAGASADMQAAIEAEQAAGRKAPESWYRFMIARLYKAKDADGTLTWTRGWLANYGTKENWRDAIIAFGFQGSGAKRLTDRNLLDLYRLMRATHSLGGQKEVLDYAASALKVGIPAEAKSVIDEGRTSGTIPAGNVTATDYYAQAKSGIAGDKGSSTAAGAGDVFLGGHEYAKAADKYRAALAGAADPDTINLHLGIALAMSGDKAGAQAALGAVKSGANLDIAKLWTTYVLTPPTA